MPAATALTPVAADVASAGPADATGVALARPTGLEALSLLRLSAAFAEGLAWVRPRRPGGFQSQWTQHRARENGPETAQRFAARYRLGQWLGEFIEQMVHD